MLEEGVDFYYNENGYIVFTKEYHLKRGYCCKNGCLNCPWSKLKEEGDRSSEKSLKKI